MFEGCAYGRGPFYFVRQLSGPSGAGLGEGEWVAVLRKTGPDILPIVLLMSLVHSDPVLRQWQRSRQKANDTNRL